MGQNSETTSQGNFRPETCLSGIFHRNEKLTDILFLEQSHKVTTDCAAEGENTGSLFQALNFEMLVTRHHCGIGYLIHILVGWREILSLNDFLLQRNLAAEPKGTE